MRNISCVAILFFTLIIGISCQETESNTKKPVVIEKSECATGDPSSTLEAEAIQETIEELEQQGIIK